MTRDNDLSAERYDVSEEDIAYFNRLDLDEYERKHSMTPAEKRAVRKWVASGHSVYESPGSRYVCDLGMDFLSVWRTDHEIAAAIRGKTKEEAAAFIKEYCGYTDPTPEELARMDALRNTPVYVQRKYEKLCRQIFLLWDYLAEEGLLSDAKEYLDSHRDDEPPLDFSFILD